MKSEQPFKFDLSTLAYPLLFVLIIWAVYWVEVQFGLNFNRYGVAPRSLVGLRGILFSPFIHGSVPHLYSNSLPLLILSAALFYFYRPIAWRVLLPGFFLTGILTWVIAKEGSVHIGASGIVYLLASFLFFKGIWSKTYRLTALSLIVVFIYGSLVWGVFPGEEKVSWEGHLSGLISGIVMAFRFKNYTIQEKKYEWQNENYVEEEDEFMKHFDEHGNFVPSSEMEAEVEEPNESEENSSGMEKPVQIVYRFVEKKKEDKNLS